MAKRSISKNFNDKDELGEMVDWVVLNLPLLDLVNPDEGYRLKQKITITINLDPDHRGNLIPEGPKTSHHRARTRPQ